MGQQQLLLLTLGIVIVGLATVAGIQIFSENRVKANADAGVLGGLRIVTACQVWALTPGLLGGMGANETLGACDFDEIGYPTSTGASYTSVDGDYTLATSHACSAAPVIPSGRPSFVYVNFHNADTEVSVCIGIAGTQVVDIGTQVDFYSPAVTTP
jgi:hypothetical protein